MSIDVAFQLKRKRLEKRLPHFVNARVNGSSGLQLSTLLRWYFVEYLNRLATHGPESFPTSFNVVEAFMSFNREFMLFDLRDEVEHLLLFNDYLRWYASGDIPREPRILEDIMSEGRIYSYEFVGDAGGFRLSGDSQQVFAGVSFIRHANELSCLLLAGENPPLDSDKEIRATLMQRVSAPGREDIVEAEELTIQDRYLQGYSGFAKVIVLTRFDLRARKHDLRYVNLDQGASFRILTDDPTVFEYLPQPEVDRFREASVRTLARYDDIFAALAAMIYLPAFFAAYPERVRELEVATELQASREDRAVQRTINEIGESQCAFRRKIRCLSGAFGIDDGPQQEVTPPDLQFKCDGFWKPIGPIEIGEDKNGDPVVGRTWVSRHESWSARSPKSFMLERPKTAPGGPDPGIIYVQRCPACEPDLYKVGLSRRNAEERAAELTAGSGVALPFGVLATWEVGDCGRVEQEVHKKLAGRRINPRREFFLAELSLLTRTIEAVIAELAR